MLDCWVGDIEDKVYSNEREVLFTGTPQETVDWLKDEHRPDVSDVWVGTSHDWMSKSDYLNWRNIQQVQNIIRGVMFRQASAVLLDQPIENPQSFVEEISEKIAKLYQ